MSEMTPCNFCTKRRMEARGYHAATPDEVDALKEKFGGGVYMVNADGEFAAWLQELSDHCVC